MPRVPSKYDGWLHYNEETDKLLSMQGFRSSRRKNYIVFTLEESCFQVNDTRMGLVLFSLRMAGHAACRLSEAKDDNEDKEGSVESEGLKNVPDEKEKSSYFGLNL